MNNMDKKTLRKEILSNRSNLKKEVRVHSENLIFDQLCQMNAFSHANVIASFVSFRDEISTDAINRFILESGKTLLLPYISMQTKEMTFHKVNALDELIVNTYGIPEPNPEIHEGFDIQKIECVLTPGLGFDKQGYRLGYGGGFYDRLFQTIKKTIPKIGIAFSIQLVDTLPIETFDSPITHLITELGIIDFRHLT